MRRKILLYLGRCPRCRQRFGDYTWQGVQVCWECWATDEVISRADGVVITPVNDHLPPTTGG